jgi:hypothetical protein
MMSPEIIATIIAVGAALIASVIGIYSQLNSKVSVIDEKIAQLEEQGRIDAAERKEQTKVLHNLALSIQRLSGFLEANQNLPRL